MPRMSMRDLQLQAMIKKDSSVVKGKKTNGEVQVTDCEDEKQSLIGAPRGNNRLNLSGMKKQGKLGSLEGFPTGGGMSNKDIDNEID